VLRNVIYKLVTITQHFTVFGLWAWERQTDGRIAALLNASYQSLGENYHRPIRAVIAAGGNEIASVCPSVSPLTFELSDL